MLVLRALPFSFSILWRMLLVLPFVAIFAVICWVVSLFMIMFFAVISPVVAIVLMIVVSIVTFSSVSILPTLVGMRLALESQGVQPKNTYGRLVLPTFGYGLIEGLLVVLVIVAFAFVLASGSPLTFNDIFMDPNGFSESDVAPILTENPSLFLIGFLGVFIAIAAIRAALLGPLAGASVGCDPDGQPHTPLYGFGSRFLSLLIVVIVAWSGLFVSGFVIAALAGALGLEAEFQAMLLQSEMLIYTYDFSQLTWGVGLWIAFTILIWVWAQSYQAAGAAMAYLDKTVVCKAIVVEQTQVAKMSDDDLRNLWKSRMPAGKSS